MCCLLSLLLFFVHLLPRILNRSNSFASVFLFIKCEESQSVSPTGGGIAMEHGKVDALVQGSGTPWENKGRGGTFEQSLQILH